MGQNKHKNTSVKLHAIASVKKETDNSDTERDITLWSDPLETVSVFGKVLAGWLQEGA